MKSFPFALRLLLSLIPVIYFAICPEAIAGDEAQVFSAYGFLLPTWTLSSAAVESFSQPNISAYTAAGNPVLATSPDQARSSFQVAQSRLGFLLKPALQTTGRIEFDFIDFTKSSPTTASLPRVRRAVVEYSPSSDLLLRFGQDWDLISPLAPHSYNFVGHYFESGDIGFMRIQAQAVLRKGKSEHAFAIGLPSANNSSADSAIELGLLPTLALREAFHFSETSQIGVSVLAAGLRQSTASSNHLFAGAATGFFETKLSEDTELKTEAFLGQNTSNLGLLGLAFGNAASPDVREAGAFASVHAKLSSELGCFAGLGGSWILDTSKMSASYTTSAAGVSTLSGTGPGIESNWTARVGAEWKANPKLTFFGEGAVLGTRHHLLASDAAIHDSSRSAVVTQVGSMLSF